MHSMTRSTYAIHTMSSTPKIRFRPSASSASTPPSRMPLIAASTRKIGSIGLDPHVGLAHEVLLGEVAGPPFHLDAAHLEHVRAVHELQYLAHVLLHHQDRVAL